MNMKKVAVLALSLTMIAAIAVTGTIAYFTDVDAQTNAFTIGNVKIDLTEFFDKEEAEGMMPGENVGKEVFVKNTGDNPAYVRVHIAMPTAMDDGDPTFVAKNNFLHFNFSPASYAGNLWSWGETAETPNYPGNGNNGWNFYYAAEDGKPVATAAEAAWNVYVVTYETILTKDQETEQPAIWNVYLDKSVKATAGENGTTKFTDDKGNEVVLEAGNAFNIKVFAEGTQSEGFADAHSALNAAFGVPGTYNAFGYAQKGDTDHVAVDDRNKN